MRRPTAATVQLVFVWLWAMVAFVVFVLAVHEHLTARYDEVPRPWSHQES
jgi:hypothetical protein